MNSDGLTAGYAYAGPVDLGFPKQVIPSPDVSWYGCPSPGVTTDPLPFLPPAVVLPTTAPTSGVVEEARVKLNRLEARRAVLESELALVVPEIETLRKMLAAVEAAP